MKKYKKIIIIVAVGIVLAIAIGYGLYRALVDENALSISEKKWLDENSSDVISVAIPNDLPVFGMSGAGVFFDFTTYLTDELGININNNTVSYASQNEGYRFEITTEYDPDGLLLFDDHYVLVSKNTGLIYNSSDIPNLHPGVLNTGLELVATYYGVSNDTFTTYESYSEITEALGNGNLEYALVPLTEYKEELIANNINALYHVSDLKKYYYFRLGDNKMVNSIFTKLFNSWKDRYYSDSYDENNYQLFIDMLEITEADADTLTNKVYRYGFAENRPYEILAGGEYGGITAQYLQSFSDFADVEFSFKKYRNSTELAEAAIAGDIDLYYNYYDLITNYIDCGALSAINYYVIADNSIDLSLSNINGLANQTVYVLNNSYLYDLIKDLNGIEIITYDTVSELKKIVKRDAIILLDENTYNYYLNKITDSYSVRYRGFMDQYNYTFRYQNDTDTFYKLFSAYTKTIDPQDLIRLGITTYNQVNSKGKIIGSIAIYVLIVVGVAGVGVFVYERNKKKVKINTKVKKEDKLKYIDLLTSLKNRNYYNEKLNVWNKNTIYPQSCIVIDINRVKELNDTYGHEEGDRQIQAVANVLIKTQVDNSEIIRTDGNEFMIYMVGYSEKQILSYMKKLVKEFKNLPYNYGVAMGFSMIEDDTKLVEDAFNEASIKMRENKELAEENNGQKD